MKKINKDNYGGVEEDLSCGAIFGFMIFIGVIAALLFSLTLL